MRNLAQVWGRAPRGDAANFPAIDWPDNKQLIGIEIEAESSRGNRRGADIVFPRNIAPYWRETNDGSLQSGVEYVLASPMAGANLSAAIHQFFADGTKLRQATTSGTHIHIDMMEEHTPVSIVQSLVLFVYIIEDALYSMIDPGRKYGGFTNALSSAPSQLLAVTLKDGADENPSDLIDLCSSNQTYKYYGLNVQPLGSYGSVEFRYFPTATSPEQLIDWVKLVQSIKLAALSLLNKEGVAQWLASRESYEAFIRSALGPWADNILAVVRWEEAANRFSKALLTVNAHWDTRQMEYDYGMLENNKRIKKFVKKNTRKDIKQLSPDVNGPIPDYATWAGTPNEISGRIPVAPRPEGDMERTYVALTSTTPTPGTQQNGYLISGNTIYASYEGRYWTPIYTTGQTAGRHTVTTRGQSCKHLWGYQKLFTNRNTIYGGLLSAVNASDGSAAWKTEAAITLRQFHDWLMNDQTVASLYNR